SSRRRSLGWIFIGLLRAPNANSPGALHSSGLRTCRPRTPRGDATVDAPPPIWVYSAPLLFPDRMAGTPARAVRDREQRPDPAPKSPGDPLRRRRLRSGRLLLRQSLSSTDRQQDGTDHRQRGGADAGLRTHWMPLLSRNLREPPWPRRPYQLAQCRNSA